MTYDDIIQKLRKAKRKYKTVDNWRKVELFCVNCEQSLGVHDMYYESQESLKYCNDCAKKFIKEVPIKINDTMTILEDSGNHIVLRYEDIRNEETKQCYFTSKGRYIKVHGKRLYI